MFLGDFQLDFDKTLPLFKQLSILGILLFYNYWTVNFYSILKINIQEISTKRDEFKYLVDFMNLIWLIFSSFVGSLVNLSTGDLESFAMNFIERKINEGSKIKEQWMEYTHSCKMA